MKAVLIFLRHLADYIVGISYIAITLFAGFLIIDEYFPDSDTEVKFFVWVVTAGIIIGIFAIVGDCLDKTNETTNPTAKYRYRILVKGKDIDQSYDCKEYTIKNNIDNDWILTMDGLESVVPKSNAILVTDIE